ncbi:hypothetical protein [Vibrio pectenicida]|uniref:Uncharacterized protein n=1 Tax=Vibrio pectenicida TaxID=62763 RepID=A0A3R9EHE4_9VIBR|nr:hypothetical protein [Vibrio pectenicida]RSD30490.1 hypothetical protein EJA03_13520 [Vibrio pectenicida]
MKLSAFIFSTLLLASQTVYANTTTYVYCGLPDASDWEWLLDENDNYMTIPGKWGRITEASGHYFKVFRVSEEVWQQKSFNCPSGYTSQPADSGTSRWEIFEVIRSNGSSYFINGYKTYYLQGQIDANFQLRV